MSARTDAARKRAARKRYAKKLALWNDALRKARAHFWRVDSGEGLANPGQASDALRLSNGSRFKAGTDRVKHLRGYWQQIEEIARKRFGGKKPRALPFTGKLSTGRLRVGGIHGAIGGLGPP
jgi:hypothetical protein